MSDDSGWAQVFTHKELTQARCQRLTLDTVSLSFHSTLSSLSSPSHELNDNGNTQTPSSLEALPLHPAQKPLTVCVHDDINDTCFTKYTAGDLNQIFKSCTSTFNYSLYFTCL